jgi:hypothetical protein
MVMPCENIRECNKGADPRTVYGEKIYGGEINETQFYGNGRGRKEVVMRRVGGYGEGAVTRNRAHAESSE